MNDFVALLIAVMAFLLTMILGEATLLALHDVIGYNETLLALGPPLRLLASFGTGWLAYRKLLGRAAPPPAAIFTKA